MWLFILLKSHLRKRKREKKRKKLLALVRQVREEMGDYDVQILSSVNSNRAAASEEEVDDG